MHPLFPLLIALGESFISRKEGPKNLEVIVLPCVQGNAADGLFSGTEQALQLLGQQSCNRLLQIPLAQVAGERAVSMYQAAMFVFLHLASWKEELKAAGEVSSSEMV